ncbi:hypothetical protein BDY19DRAFT_224799 [Irpex rosettiformis]|uniref:Uncharacterized protein n=1 Tax=Irpex rosettiformis TaxID=378272 RepID=A0ACB8U153_9APHY|nr:hypothetical protein BDY19DRAFT_224799 [Irpex rosettiformis]
MLNDVPGDIVIAVLEYVSLHDLASLALTCRVLYQLVEEYGWRSYLKIHPRPCYGYAKTFISWSARDQLRLRAVGDTNWRDKEFVARPLSQRWVSKLQPILSINPSRLILAAGSHIYTYDFHPSPSARHAAPVKPECTYVTTMLHPSRDITSMVSVPDGDNDRTIFVGYADGALERLVLPSKSKTHETPFAIRAPEECHNLHNGEILESLSVSSNHLLSLSASGKAGLLSLNSLDRQHTSINLGYRSWCGYLSMGSSSPFAAFGTTSPHAFSTHNIYSSHIDPRASVYLSPGSHLSTTSAVYAIVRAPPSSPWGASHQIIVSGWYDGLVHVHDLRSSSRTPSSNDHSIPSLLPTLTLADPWSYEPIYSLCSGGGSDAHVVAGSARHSVLAFWDVRSPNFGWSVHAPGNDSSPVYSVVMDGSRVFGANESRGFVLDFGGGVMEDTYPPIAHDPVPTATNRNWRRGRVGSAGGDATLKKDTTNGPGFYVTKYNHGKL